MDGPTVSIIVAGFANLVVIVGAAFAVVQRLTKVETTVVNYQVNKDTADRQRDILIAEARENLDKHRDRILTLEVKHEMAKDACHFKPNQGPNQGPNQNPQKSPH